MKGLLLAGTVLLTSWNHQANNHIQENDTSLLSHRINHQNIQSIYGIYNERQKALKRYRLYKLPPKIQGQGIAISNNVTLIAGDNGVSSATLRRAAAIINNISLPILEETTGKPQGVRIFFFTNQRSYSNMLAKAGVPTSQVKQIVSGTEGLAAGNDIVIPLYSLHNQSELADSLTHELTHTVMNNFQNSDTLPVWINEGYAWYNGMAAKAKSNPSFAKQTESILNTQVKEAANKGRLLPLSASEDDILQAAYTVEWVDYLAVKNLIAQKGLDTFKSFIADIPSKGIDSSFEEHYQTQISQYETGFEQSLGIVQANE